MATSGTGPASRIRSTQIFSLHQPCPLDDVAGRSLSCWNPRLGEALTMEDAAGIRYRARVQNLGEPCVVVPFERLLQPMESPVWIDVFQALPQRERFELILQKLTEIGVARIVPYESQRSITLEERDDRQKKSHRWPDVVLKAAKQSRRAMIPELSAVLSWDAALYEARHADQRLFFYEGTPRWSLHKALEGGIPRRIALFVGPEGGFSDDEVNKLRTLDVQPVSLGPRVLRTETAAIVGAAVVQHVLGDLF